MAEPRTDGIEANFLAWDETVYNTRNGQRLLGIRPWWYRIRRRKWQGHQWEHTYHFVVTE